MIHFLFNCDLMVALGYDIIYYKFLLKGANNDEGIKIRASTSMRVPGIYQGMFYHRNIISLPGYCTENNNRFLVYEFMHLSTLSQHIFHLEHNEIKPLNLYSQILISLDVLLTRLGVWNFHSYRLEPFRYSSRWQVVRKKESLLKTLINGLERII